MRIFAPTLGRRRAAVAEVGQLVVKQLEGSVVFGRDAMTCLGVKMSNDLGGIRVGGRSDDDARHYPRSAASLAALRALCSSSVISSPRATSASASST